jgi:hypothetical protein
MKWPKLKRDYKGFKIKTIRALKNGFMEIPEGCICTITEGRSYWVSFSTEPCPHCGVKILMRKVSRENVILIEQPEFKGDKV